MTAGRGEKLNSTAKMGPIVASWMASQERLATRREGGIFPCRHVNIIMICLEWRRVHYQISFESTRLWNNLLGPPRVKDQRNAPPAPALWAPYTRLTWISAGRCSWMMYQGPNLQSGAWQKVVAKGSCKKMLGEDGAWQRNIKADALVPCVLFRPLAKTFMHSVRLVS